MWLSANNALLSRAMTAESLAGAVSDERRRDKPDDTLTPELIRLVRFIQRRNQLLR